MEQKHIHVTDTHAGVDHELLWDGGKKIQWISSDGTVRTPEEKNKTFLYPGLFFAAGKPYTSWKSLCASTDDSGILAKDIYGREVLYIFELFPCFDSYDYANEDRYYRWFFIKEKEKLTRIYYADERHKIEVTEDVENLENKCREYLQKAGWLK